MNNAIKKNHSANSPLLKRGVGEHIYLMFAGRPRSYDEAEVPAKPHGLRKLVPILLLVAVACMIGIVLWRSISAMR